MVGVSFLTYIPSCLNFIRGDVKELIKQRDLSIIHQLRFC